MSKMNYQLVEIDGETCRDYDLEYIKANPIPAKCKKCKRTMVDGKRQTVIVFANGKPVERMIIANDAIRAPSLENCRCFYCGGELGPLVPGGPVTVEQVEQLKSLNQPQPMLQVF